MYRKRILMSSTFVWILILVLTVTNSQSLCPSTDGSCPYLDALSLKTVIKIHHLVFSIDLRNYWFEVSSGFAVVNTEVIKASDGVTLQNIHVSWTYAHSQTYDCTDAHIFKAVITVYNRTTVTVNGQRSSYSTSDYYLSLRDNQFELLNPDCNNQYQVALDYNSRRYVAQSYPPVVFGSLLSSPPSKIPQVFVGSDQLDPNSRLSIFWYPLPCHLQNGDDVTSYTLWYSFANNEEVNRTISTLDDILSCNQEPLGPYRCYLTNSLLLEDKLYTFQVAAMNGFGIGPFSDPVNATLFSQAVSKVKQNSTSVPVPGKNTDLDFSCACISSLKDALIVAGSLVAAMTVVIGVVSVVALILCIFWWRRVDSYFEHHHSKLHERSTRDEIKTDKCQAYRMVTFPTAEESTSNN